MADINVKNPSMGKIRLVSYGEKQMNEDIQFSLTSKGIRDSAKKINDIFNDNTASLTNNALWLDHFDQAIFSDFDKGRQDLTDKFVEIITKAVYGERTTTHFRKKFSQANDQRTKADPGNTLPTELQAKVAAQDTDPTYAKLFEKEKNAQRDYDDNIAIREGFIIVPKEPVVNPTVMKSLSLDDQVAQLIRSIPNTTNHQ